MLAKYAAVTTLGSGYWVVLIGEDGTPREEVHSVALAIVENRYHQGLLDSSELKLTQQNMFVTSLSAARRAYPKAVQVYEFARMTGMPH